MAIKFGSALDSIARRGIAHDGPINGGGLAANIAAVPGVTTADKVSVKPVKQKPVKPPAVKLDVKQADEPARFDRKAYMREYMAKKRAGK